MWPFSDCANHGGAAGTLRTDRRQIPLFVYFLSKQVELKRKKKKGKGESLSFEFILGIQVS